MTLCHFHSFEDLTEADTAELAKQIGASLVLGDTLLLEGNIGAGKTYFARKLVQSLQDDPEDVPSPTFTIVQTYQTRLGEVWHADLYRLTSQDELIEIGLTEAMELAICLIEWPDRLGSSAPTSSLTLSFTAPTHDTRNIECLASNDSPWPKRIEALA